MSIEYTAARTFCSSKEIYERYEGYIHTVPNIAREWKVIFVLIKDYYLEYDQDAVDAQELHDFFDLQHPNARNAEAIHIMVTEIFNHEPKPHMIQAIVEQYIEKHKATKIIDMLAPTMTGDDFGKLPEVVREAEQFFDVMENPPEEMDRVTPVSASISELVEEELIFDGLEWPLEFLNDILGGIRKRTLGLIYAYVDCGKTSLALNVAANAARQLVGTDECIVYLGNEEPAKRMAIRGVQAFKHVGRKEVMANHAEYTKECMQWGYDNIKFFGGIDTGDHIIQVLKEFKPRLAIVDIATDVEVQMERHYGSEGVGYLKSLFKWYRRLGHRFDTSMLCVGQGTGEIANKRYPNLTDVYGSRSAVQGALDYAIGIGRKTDDAAKEYIRYLNIPKNKLHDGFKAKAAVQFDAEVCQWSD